MLTLAASVALALPTPPTASDPASVARNLARTLTWGHFSTISTRAEGTAEGAAFGNPYSFADVDGVPYIYASQLDASCIDLWGDDAVST